MKRKHFLTLVPLCLIAICLLVPACSRQEDAGHPEAANDVAYYTCTMHPSVRSQDPKGKCPICGMDLVPVLHKAQAAMPNGADPRSFPARPRK